MACSFLFSPIQLPRTPGRRASEHHPRIFAQATNRLSSEALQKDYYEVLGVGVDASYAEIRKAYRRLQKIHHPDVAGPEGHAMTLLLNEAYQTLTSQELRQAYTSSNVKNGMHGGASVPSYTGFAYSAWNGPDRPDAVFVDENTCIGCRECVFHANKTFAMDESLGSARVTAQWGDSDTQIKTAMEACPVNCIHFVDKNDLPILEYLMRPQRKASNGVYGGGWERPSNVFMAAKTFKRKMEANSSSSSGEERYAETPAQRKARIYADLKMQAGSFWWLWSWGFRDSVSSSKENDKNDTDGWFGLFGTSKSSNVLRLSIEQSEASKVVKVVQQWALTFASSSELPLPLPFKADPLENGVELTLVSASNGILETKGSLIVTIDEEEAGTFLNVKRRGVTGTKALPGERTIIRHLKDAVQECDSDYSFYHISSDSVNSIF